MPPPRLLSISPPDPAGAAAWVARAEALADAGADGLLLRVPGARGLPLERWLDQLVSSGAAVLVHVRTPGGLRLARARGLGLHLSATAARPRTWSGPCSRSCHDERDLARAAGCAWATLSPVFPPASKPRDARPPLGLPALAAACAHAPLPILALGGIDPERVAACLAAGAWGLAGIGAFQDPARVRELRAALGERPARGSPRG
jgi:thiamine-phosphate pyrophosphorylase